MSLRYLGPIAVSFHGDPSFSWAAPTGPSGFGPVTIAGSLEWVQAQQLAELVRNPARRVTIGPATGVLEVIWSDDELLRPNNGFYLLTGCRVSGDHKDSVSSAPAPFSLDAVYLGQRLPILSRSSRAVVNDYGLAGQATIGAPFYDEDDSGSLFFEPPGGTWFTREYDATVALDVIRTESDDARRLALYAGTPADLDAVAYPVFSNDSREVVPGWVSNRSGDCRVYDRRSMSEVFGPTHEFVQSSDIAVTNGLVRAWVGARGLPAYLQMEAFADGEWHQVGLPLLAGSAQLRAARVVKLTPEEVNISISLQNEASFVVTLKRGWRMFRTTSRGAGPVWSGMPPAERADVAIGWTGFFGGGIDAGGPEGSWAEPFESWAGDDRFSWDGERITPDFRLLWPRSVLPDEWARAIWWRANEAAADLTAGAGVLSVLDEDLVGVARLWFDPADFKFKFILGGNTVESDVQTFAAGDDLLFVLRFSTERGMALSVRSDDGTVTHYADANAVDPGTDGRWDQVAYFVNFSVWGDDGWGDEPVWGGESIVSNGTVSDDKLFDCWLDDLEVGALAAAAHALDGLPLPLSRLVWHAPYDAKPVPAMSALTDGRRVDADVDDAGFQKVSLVLNAEQLVGAVALARDEPFGDSASLHNQLAAESEQQVRVA
jgi:hypothetical protein